MSITPSRVCILRMRTRVRICVETTVHHKVAKRKLGYYALPLLLRHEVIGWGNIEVGALNKRGALTV